MRQDLNQFQQETSRRFEAQDRRFDAIDRRFESVDHHFDAIDRRFESVDHRFDKLDRLWAWTVGLIAVMALGLLAKLLIPGA